ncbi:MAG TPA: hypothetical protein VFK04_05010 [Gemmatimonadaceae bacterium]|nr:hypothetical protein [Gemmatimonadaceae bacterium]
MPVDLAILRQRCLVRHSQLVSPTAITCELNDIPALTPPMESPPSLRDAEVPTLAREAERFLARHRWCARVSQVTSVFAISGVLGIFRCSLVPSDPSADAVVWVIVGDLPPAYIAYEPEDCWQDALRGYVEETEEWVEGVRTGASLDDVIPVNAPATPEYADMLASRLELIRKHLLEIDLNSVENDV